MSTATSRRNWWLIWALAFAPLLLLVLWARSLWAGYLVAGTAAFTAAALVAHRQRGHLSPATRQYYLLGLVLLGTGLLVGGVALWRFELIEFRWERLRTGREQQLANQVARRMEELREAGSNAAAVAAATAADPVGYRQLFQRLARLRERTGVDALAVYANDGDLVAWSGEHRGALPDSVQAGERRFYFEERPLFSYLYFMQPVPGRAEFAVAAILVETALGGEPGAAGDEVRSPVGPGVSFHTAHQRTPGRHVWSLLEQGDTVVQAVVRPVTQAELRAQVEWLPRLLTVLLALTAFVAFSVALLAAGLGTRAYRSVPLLALLPLLALIPAGDIVGVRPIFLPSFFVLPRDLTLGRLLLLLAPIAALVAGLRRPAVPAHRRSLVVLTGAAAVAVAYPGALRLLIGAASRPLLERGSALWLALQFACVLLLVVATALALPRVRAAGRPGRSSRWRGWLAPLGALLATALGLLVATLVSPSTPTTRFAAAWSLAFVLVAVGTASGAGRRAALRRWSYAGWLAITASIPHLWIAQVNARMRSAEEELGTLGTQSTYLNFSLEEFGNQALARAYTGEVGVQLLYRTWVASGLARESYPVRITQWSPGNLPRVQLGSYQEELTSTEARVLVELLDEARTEGSPGVYRFPDQPHMSSVLAIPLPTGDVITVLVPPRRTLGRPTGVALFFGTDESSALRNLVPAPDPNTPEQPLEWQQARGGWRARSLVQYPDGRYYAHLLVRLPPPGVWLARAVIVSALDLALLLLLWGIGALARGASPWPRAGIAATLGSFRARVTLALFAFFLIPTVAFGYAAYHALAQEVERATRVVAERAASQAVREYPAVFFDLRALAQHSQTDVLRFQGGELIEVSSPEAFALGVYSAWMPPLAYAQLQTGEEEAVVVVQEFSGQPFVTAYNAVQPSGTLAIPMPLVSGDIAVRQRELAHLIIFAAILGALLSLALSVAVGRALAGPIGLLRRAAAAVGAGRLRVRLPEEEGGEFGQLFTSFNRMVRRLRRARARELRTARVLAWGEMARQVAHEIKNPLTPIKLSVQHIRRAHHDRHPEFGRVLEASVNEILREIDRLSDIARAFSRYGAPALAAGPLEAVDLGAVIQEALTLYRAADDAVSYSAIVEPGIPRVSARAGELKEVLLNLLENARTALRGRGSITVRALQRGERIDVEVEDNGSGIAPELLERVFDPHFSTHSSGTGLGLAIVRRLVESWQGSVTVESRPGEGTSVIVRLRPAPAPAGSSVTARGS